MGVESVALASLALTAVSAGVTTYATLEAGKAQKKSADYEADVAANNAIRANRMAEDARERGRIAEGQVRERTKQVVGQQRAGAAARGVLVDEGSALAQTLDTVEIGELDALTTRVNAEREAIGREDQATDFRNQAELTRYNGASAKSGSQLAAVGTALGGAGTVSSRWYKFYGEQ